MRIARLKLVMKKKFGLRMIFFPNFFHFCFSPPQILETHSALESPLFCIMPLLDDRQDTA